MFGIGKGGIKRETEGVFKYAIPVTRIGCPASASKQLVFNLGEVILGSRGADKRVYFCVETNFDGGCTLGGSCNLDLLTTKGSMVRFRDFTLGSQVIEALRGTKCRIYRRKR